MRRRGGEEKQPISRAIGQPEDIALFGKGAFRRKDFAHDDERKGWSSSNLDAELALKWMR